MKNLKRIYAVFIVLLLAVSFNVGTFADDDKEREHYGKKHGKGHKKFGFIYARVLEMKPHLSSMRANLEGIENDTNGIITQLRFNHSDDFPMKLEIAKEDGVYEYEYDPGENRYEDDGKEWFEGDFAKAVRKLEVKPLQAAEELEKQYKGQLFALFVNNRDENIFYRIMLYIPEEKKIKAFVYSPKEKDYIEINHMMMKKKGFKFRDYKGKKKETDTAKDEN